MYRKGDVPRHREESELFVHSFTRKGFFGPYANMFKTRNPGEPIRWDKRLGPCGIPLEITQPTDLSDPRGGPLALFENQDVTISVSRRREPMPFCWRNADADELFFVHSGSARFETELGLLTADPGDFVYLPRNAVYRVIPETPDTIHIIVATAHLLEPADRYHRDHGETSAGLDLSLIVVPEPGVISGDGRDEYEVRTQVDGEVYSAFFDYDPVAVTVGWSGDPVVFKLSAWDVPSASLPSTPPTAAVFMTEERDCVVTVHTPSRGSGAGGGPPAHSNDYDEIWFLHASGDASRSGRLGTLRWEPQGVTQPGFRRSNGTTPRPASTGPTLNLNVDVQRRLRLTKAAEAYVDAARAEATAGV